jgi:hypothetical protein
LWVPPARGNRAPESNSGQLVEKEINSGNPAVPGNDEISTGVSRRFARTALQPLDPPAIAHFLWLSYWLISEVKVGSPNRARDSI